MKIKTRFIKSIAETAVTSDTALPWTRGARRAAFIAKRSASEAPRKTA